jgi:hypothetical protein
MSQQEPDTDTEDEPEIQLADPDDYHRTQRLKEIHKARRRVTEKVADLDVNRRHPSKIKTYSITELNHTVAMYINELIPLIEHADVTQEDISLPDTCAHDDVIQYARGMGMGEDGGPVSPAHSMEVYRTCNRILADVKPLIEEDDSDEWEV